MFLASKERRYVKRLVKRLLVSRRALVAEKPGLSGQELYRDVLLHSGRVDAKRADRIMRQVEDSIDEWTSDTSPELQFRQVVHFFILSQYLADGNSGTVVSFRKIVYGLVPAEL